MAIILLVWALVIFALLGVVLWLASVESKSGWLSAHIPDGFEWHQRRIREAERKRGTSRVVAPGLAIQPMAGIKPGSTSDPASSFWSGADEPVVATSHSVVEVHAFSRQPEGQEQMAAPHVSVSSRVRAVPTGAQGSAEARERERVREVREREEAQVRREETSRRRPQTTERVQALAQQHRRAQEYARLEQHQNPLQGQRQDQYQGQRASSLSSGQAVQYERYRPRDRRTTEEKAQVADLAHLVSRTERTEREAGQEARQPRPTQPDQQQGNRGTEQPGN